MSSFPAPREGGALVSTQARAPRWADWDATLTGSVRWGHMLFYKVTRRGGVHLFLDVTSHCPLCPSLECSMGRLGPRFTRNRTIPVGVGHPPGPKDT